MIWNNKEINGIEIRPKSDDLYVELDNWKYKYLNDWSLFWWYDVFWNIISWHSRVEHKIFNWTWIVYNNFFFTCDNIFHKIDWKKEENLYFFYYKENNKLFYFYDHEKEKFQRFLRSWDLKDLENEINFLELKFSEKKDLIKDYKMFI